MTVIVSADGIMGINKLVRREYPADTAGGRASVDRIVEIVFSTMYGQPLHPTIYGQAAALMEGIIRTHPFRDGNKRTALLAACSLLGVNGITLVMPPGTAEFVIGVARDTGDSRDVVDRIAKWLKDNSAPG